MNKIKFISIFIIVFFSFLKITNAAIDFTVSPIKYEINSKTWETITKTATLYNNSNETYYITTWVSDFEASWNNGNPKFVRKSELIYPEQELASWININTSNFIINWWESKDIDFEINIPENATPWWHYWAIFFKKSTSVTWAEVWINVDYWILILLNIDWEIIEEAEIDDIIISSHWQSSNRKKDDCPIWDLTKSYYDWKCIDDLVLKWLDENIDTTIKQIEDLSVSDIEKNDFNINFNIWFINKWNTHIKPNWKITLIDEDWNKIKAIWKKTIKNSDWIIIWEKIVDYLPINDNDSNALPYIKRNYLVDWKWFPYESYNENGEKIIKYWSPENYYTRKNIEERTFLMPWERVAERVNIKKIKAIIELWYTKREWENIEFNSAKEFEVSYKEQYIALNPYFFIIIWIILLIIFLLWLLFRKKKKKCEKCSKKINKDMKICPYCWAKQKTISKKSKKS